MTHLHHLAAAVCAVAATACFRADVGNCTATCATANDCPAGLACTASGLCAESASTVCTGAPDAAPDSGPGILMLTVRDPSGAPEIGVRVLVARADGSTVADTTTGGDGAATIAVPGTVDVTVARTNGLGSRVTTILAAEAGDFLVFGPEPNAPPSVAQDVSWPADPTANTYVVHSSCTITPQAVTAPSVSTTIMLDPICAGDHDLLVTDFDAGLAQRHYQFAPAAVGPDVTLTGPWLGYTFATVNLAQLPPEVTVSSMSMFATNVFRTGDPARGYSSMSPVAGAGGGGTAEISLPPIGVGREMQLVAYHDDDLGQIQQIVERVPIAGQYNLSVTPAMVPWLPADPVVDTTARTIGWQQLDAGPGSGPGDLIALELTYAHGGANYTWRVIAPVAAATGTSDRVLALPDLPGAEPFELRPTDSVSAPWVRVYGFAGGLGYAGVRERADVAIADHTQSFTVLDTFTADSAITRYAVSHRGD